MEPISGGRWKARLEGGKKQITALESTTPIAPSAEFTIVCSSVVLRVEADRYFQATGRVGVIWPAPHFERLVPISEAESVVLWPTRMVFNEAQLMEFVSGKRST